MSGPSGDRLKTRRTDDGGSSPRRGVGFQPACRVITRCWLGWAWLCSLARRAPTNLEVRRHGLDRRLLMDDGLRFIKPKKLGPPRSGDSDEWAERRQVENPSYGRRGFVAPSWRRLSACGASHQARLARLGAVVLRGMGYRQTWTFVDTGQIKCHRWVRKSAHYETKVFAVAGERGFG